MQIKTYDLIIIGSGSGANILGEAIAHGLNVALVDKGPLGGTCLNVGCIPSKMLIYPAYCVVEIQEAGKLGIAAEVRHIDFRSIMERMRRTVEHARNHIRKGLEDPKDFSFYEGEAFFTGDYTLDVNGKQIKGNKIIIASGARPFIPDIKGIKDADYLTNESVLGLVDPPQSIIIIGGGYIAVEYAHFFAAMGTKVFLIQRNKRLVPEEEPEISELLQRALSRRMHVHTSTEAVEVKKKGAEYLVYARGPEGAIREFHAEKIMIAAGRRSNADTLRVENTGVKTDSRGYIEVNEFFETSKKNIWAFGDIIGKKMFKHVANREAGLVWHNVAHGREGKKARLDYNTAPHAVFSWPEIASVGLTEMEARSLFPEQEIMIGRARYSEVAWGEAMMEEEAFAKAIVARENGKILGFHIIGPHASILIQEVINAMANEQPAWTLGRSMHIHPALSEVVLAALANLE